MKFMIIFFYNFAKSSLVGNNVINIVFQDVKHLTLNRSSCIKTDKYCHANRVTVTQMKENESCLSCLCGKGTTAVLNAQVQVGKGMVLV